MQAVGAFGGKVGVDKWPTTADMSTDAELLDEQSWRRDVALSERNAGVFDESERHDTEESDKSPLGYEISSYGADYPVDALVKRMEAENILIPPFQRGFVWSQADASRFIESLLLGFPVPAIFLSREAQQNRFLVVDGQQRLKTLQSFYSGVIREKKFRLIGVNDAFQGKTYDDLDPFFRNRLDNAIIHAIIVQQDQPKEDDDTSIYLLFERLNSWGRPLFPQEIRACVDHGPLVALLHDINKNSAWRNVYGKPSLRLKDEELILRFLALYYNFSRYESPMKVFLNKFSRANNRIGPERAAEFREKFDSAIECISHAIGDKAFRPIKAFNAAVFDAVMVAIRRRLDNGPLKDVEALAAAYSQLLKSKEFRDVTGFATARKEIIQRRIDLATAAFAEIN